MNDLSPAAYARANEPDRWSDLDRESDEILDRYLSGQHDAERAEGIAKVKAMLDAVPPRPMPDPEEARKLSDDAVRSLLPGLLTDAQLNAHSRDQNRFKRRG